MNFIHNFEMNNISLWRQKTKKSGIIPREMCPELYPGIVSGIIPRDCLRNYPRDCLRNYTPGKCVRNYTPGNVSGKCVREMCPGNGEKSLHL